MDRVNAAFRTWAGYVFDSELLTLSASLAYTTLLALVPLATVIFSTLSMFPVFDHWSDIVEQFIFSNFVPASGATVYQYLQEFSAHAGQLTAIGLVTLMITSLLLLATIENAFNRIWGVSAGRTTGQRLMVYWTILTLGPILIVASLALSSLALGTVLDADIAALPVGLPYFIPVLPTLLEFLSFVVLYYVVPNCANRPSYVATGALVAVVLFEAAKYGFAWYVTRFDSFEVLYGALGVIPIFLIWLYISWLVVLVGARHAAILGTRR